MSSSLSSEAEDDIRSSLPDDAEDLAAFLGSVAEPGYLLGHSYGAHVALRAALPSPPHIRKLMLYEPPWPDTTAGATGPPQTKGGASAFEESHREAANLLSAPQLTFS